MAINLIGLLPRLGSSYVFPYALPNGFVGAVTPKSKESCNTLYSGLGGTSYD